MIDEDLIFAYIDGELDEQDRLRVEQAIAADPALQAVVEEHRVLADQLHRAFSPILQEPIPPAVSGSAATDSSVISLADERSRRERRWFPQPTRWFALAATLAAGIFGGILLSGSHGGPVTDGGRQLTASGQLKFALDTQLASTQGASEPVRIGVTFRNHAGAICRSFSAEATEGVACRDGKDWQLRGLLTREHAGTGDYRQAASPGSAELVDALIAGEPLDQPQERAALAADWAVSSQP